MNEIVSVVVPVYNVCNYVKKCVMSIVGQTYCNLDIILIDDGSTDISGVICDELAKNDGRIRVIHQDNMGLSGARNTGLDLAYGDFIVCVDSDDIIDKTMIEKLVIAINEYDADIAACGTEYCSEKDEYLYEKKNSKIEVLIDQMQMEALIYTEKIQTTAWGKLYKRSLFEGIRYPLGKIHEDVFTTYLLLDRSKKTVVIPEPLYIYRQVQNSIMHQKFNKKSLNGLEGAIQRANFIENKYPKLKSGAYAVVAYTGCKLYEKTLNSDDVENDIKKYLQNIVRTHLTDLLRFKGMSAKTKLFAICLSLSNEITDFIYKHYLHIENK